MNALDYAYEWLEESVTERKQKNLDEDSALLAAFVAGYEAAQQSAHPTYSTAVPNPATWVIDPNNIVPPAISG